MHVPCLNMCRSKISEKMFMFYNENAKWQCCSSKCITKLKNICDEEPSISMQNVKKPIEDCTFLRSYLVAACSFTKNKTPSQVFFHGLQ